MEEIEPPDKLLEVASKRDDPNFQQLSGHVPKEMATEFKVACTRKGVSHSDGLEQAIALWLAQGTKNSESPASGSKRKSRGKKGGDQ
jgi:hypothetical protein